MTRAMRTVFMYLFYGKCSLSPEDYRNDRLMWRQFRIAVEEEISITKPPVKPQKFVPRVIPMSPTKH